MFNKIFNTLLEEKKSITEDRKKCQDNCGKDTKKDTHKRFRGMLSELENSDRGTYIEWVFNQYLYLQETGNLLSDTEEVSTSDNVTSAETLLVYLSNRAAHFFYEDTISWRKTQVTVPSDKNGNNSVLTKVKDVPEKSKPSHDIAHTLSYDNTYLYKVLQFIKQKIDTSSSVSQHDIDERTKEHWKIANENKRKEKIVDEIALNTILKAKELFIENYDNKPCLSCKICTMETEKIKSEEKEKEGETKKSEAIDPRSVLICEENISIWQAIAASQKLKYFFRVVGKTFEGKNQSNQNYILKCENYFLRENNIFFQNIIKTEIENNIGDNSYARMISKCLQNMKTKIDITETATLKKDKDGNIWNEKLVFDCFIGILNDFIKNTLDGDSAMSIYRVLGTYKSQKGIRRAYAVRKETEFTGHSLVAIYGLKLHTATLSRHKKEFFTWFDTYIDLGEDKIDVMLKEITTDILDEQNTSDIASSPKP